MLQRLLTVGGITLGSRFTGFLRDVILAAILGAGPIADAFFVALRLPNHFRAIFAEGAFNAAFVPTYAGLRGAGRADAARSFADRIFVLLFAAQLVLLAIAMPLMPFVIDLLAPGFRNDPQRFGLAVELSRITFPYLLLVSLVTLYGGILNALDRFASAAAAPILLNLSMIVTLALAAFFPTVGHAAAWGVLFAGIAEYLLLAGDASRRGAMPRFVWPKFDADVKTFLARFGPATVGSAGTQIALFADTILASFLVAGSLSALYYADRLNQLPIGVIGVAAGTVLLPDMARRIAGGDEAGAREAQNRAVELILLLSIPCVVGFLLVPELIMRALFLRGAFTAANAQAAAATLGAYAVGLLPFVLMRAATTTFIARGDTTTPVIALFIGLVMNIALKVLLMKPYAQVGLALATSVGAWVQFLALIAFAARRKLLSFDVRLEQAVPRLAISGVILLVALWGCNATLVLLLPPGGWFRDEIALAVVLACGGLVYGGAIALLFGLSWFSAFRGQAAAAPMPDRD